MDSYTYICSKVADFNYLFGVISHSYSNNNILVDKFNSLSKIFNKSQVKLRFSLINEEIKELVQALNDNNPIEIVDALCDILYVVAGAKVYFNLPIKNEICHKLNNLYPPSKTTRVPFTDEDTTYIIQNINNPQIQNLINNDGILSLNSMLSILTDLFVNEQKKEYHKLFLNHLIEIYNKTLDKLVIGIFQISKLFNIDIIHLFDIVHNSNMTKVCETEIDAIETIKWYKINEHRYKEPVYQKILYNNKEYYVIFDKETKKILKSIKYNLVKFI